MLKLYKRHDNQLHYWEYWETRPKHGVIHWGIVSERGERKDIKAPSVTAFQALLDEQTAAKRLPNGRKASPSPPRNTT